MNEGGAPNLSTLNEFVRAACFIRKETMGREYTARFALENLQSNRVLYALDTGVVIVNADPMTTGPLSEDGGNGAGYVFPGDETDKTAQIKLAAALSNFVCYELSPNDLMYQLPGHAEETTRVYSAVAHKVEARGRPDYVKRSGWELTQVTKSIERLARDDELIAEVQALTKNTRADGGGAGRDEWVSAVIERFVGKIVHAYQQFNRAEHEYLNYLRLLVRRGLTSLDDAAQALNDDPQSRALAFAFEAADLEKRTFEEVVRHNQLVTLWMARIGSLKSRVSQRRLVDDAEALDTLDLVNRRLKKLPGRARMVLVTTDKHLVEAVARRMPFGENDTQGFGPEYFQSFGRKYVQHLHAFLSESLVDSDDSEEVQSLDERDIKTGQVVNWLDAFLGEKAGMTDFDPETLARVAYDENEAAGYAKKLWGQLGENGEDFKTILDQWREIRTQASNRELFIEQMDRSESLADTVREVVNSILNKRPDALNGDPVEFLTSTASQISENLWEAFVVSLSKPGARLLVGDDGDRSRNPPDIRFDSLKKAGGIVRRLIERNGFTSESELTEALGELKRDTLDSVPGNNALGYLYYLVMAAIFAKNSRWSVTYSLAQRAIAIVDSHARRDLEVKVGDGSNISAREAHYVASTAKRLLSRSWADFDVAERHLSAAQSALESDHRKGTASLQTGRRFRVEEIALHLSRFYWARHCWVGPSGPEREEAMVANITRAMSICHSIDLQIQGLPNGYKDLRRPTIVNFATNIAQIAVAHAMLGDLAPQPPADHHPLDHIETAIQLIEELSVVGGTDPRVGNAGGAPNRSYLIKVYLEAAKIFSGRAVNRREFLRLLSEDNVERHAVTQYDRARFRELRDFCIQRLGK